MLLGAYGAISWEVSFVGLMSFCVGVFLVLWENEDFARSGK